MKLPMIDEQNEAETIRLGIFLASLKTQQPVMHRILMDTLENLESRDSFSEAVDEQIDKMNEG